MMIPSKQSKNELRAFLDRKNLTPQMIADQMQVPVESIQALYDNPRLLPNIDLISLFMHIFPCENPTQMLAFAPKNPEAPIATMMPNASMDCEYLIGNQLIGKDVANSGAPSCHNIGTLQDLIP